MNHRRSLCAIGLVLISACGSKSPRIVQARGPNGRFSAADIDPVCANQPVACAGVSFGFCQTADGVCFNVESGDDGKQFCPAGTLYCGQKESNWTPVPADACADLPAQCYDSYGDCEAASGACYGTWQDANGNMNCWPATFFCPGRSAETDPVCLDPSFCHWEGTCNGSGGCDCNDPKHYLPAENCAVWHSVVVPPGDVCAPGDAAYCNYEGVCSDGSGCVCDDPSHYDAAENCATWHAHVLQPGQLCAPGDLDYCNHQGACNAAGTACDCFDVLHYSSADQCSVRHGALSQLLTEDQFDQLFPERDPLYTYAGLSAAADGFPYFLGLGTIENGQRELAAFLAQASHETTGGGASGGLHYVEELACLVESPPPACAYCDAGSAGTYPCAAGESYHGRGPLQLSWNYNYGQAAIALGADILAHPELVATDSTLTWQTAIWFWMTAQGAKPSAHDVMAGNWQPTAADTAAGRAAGFGLTTDIINGGLECGIATPAAVSDRVAFYQAYAAFLGVDPGPNLYCDTMQPY